MKTTERRTRSNGWGTTIALTIALTTTLAHSFSCSLLFDEANGSVDASVLPVDAAIADGASDAGINTDVFGEPYGCDADTAALFHFDSPSEGEACNGLVLVPPLSITVGKFDGALVATGTPPVLSTPFIHPSRTPFRIEAWVKPNFRPGNTPGDIDMIIAQFCTTGSVPIPALSMKLRRNGNEWVARLEYQQPNGASVALQDVTLDRTLPINDWTHIAFEVVDDSGTLYVNGESASLQGSPGELRALDGLTLELGRTEICGSSGEPQYGHDIDELRVSTVSRE